jgi:CHAT domain-containing protein
MPGGEDFDDITLEIRSLGEGGFETRFEAETQGEALGPFALRLDSEKLQPLLKVFQPAPNGAAIPNAREIGATLFDALFQGNVRRLFDRSRSRADEAGPGGTSRGVRLRLQMNLDDEKVRPLAALPWEMLYDPLDRTFYGHDRRHLMIRHPELPRPVEPLTVTPPLRILVIPSSPLDLEPLDLAEEVRQLEEILKGDERIQLEVLNPPTFDALRTRLREEIFHIIHFTGHGGFKPETGEGWLCFEDARKRKHRVEGPFFSDLLAEFDHLRLAVLSACHTSEVPGAQEVTPYGTVGMAVSLSGVPAVIGMQSKVSDIGAIRFAAVFYRSLAAGEPVDVAVALARRELYEKWHPAIEWALPVLYLRSKDGRIFDVPRRTETALKTAPAAPPKKENVQAKISGEPLVLGIRSREPLGDRPERTLNLTRHFDDRFIRDEALWGTAVLPELRDFLGPALTGGQPLVLDFAAHASIAFAAGYILERKSGLDITVRQRLKDGVRNWKPDAGPLPEGPYWKAEEDFVLDGDGRDVAVAVGLTWPVMDDVRLYLEKEKVPVRRLLPATLAPEPSSSGVHSGAHAVALAQALALRIRARTAEERGGTLRLFVAGPNAFLFYLGQLARGLGRIQLYEYDFEQGTPGGYRASIVLGA